MKTVIIPLYENGYYTKSVDTSDVNSYTTIALVTVASNIFEIIWLDLWNLTWIQLTFSLYSRSVTQLIVVYTH